MGSINSLLCRQSSIMKKICLLSDIPDHQAITCPYDDNYSMLVYRDGDTAYAYINSCPHAGVPLEWNADQFMSADGLLLQCGTHGAQFEPLTGHCVHGPCKGAHLHKIDIKLMDDMVWQV